MKSVIDAQAPSRSQNHWQTLKTLSRHLWPSTRRDLQLRVVAALTCLVGARLVSVYIPVIYRDAVDALAPTNLTLVLPLAVIASYGLARLATTVLGELRDFVFVRVGQHAQRTVALDTFKHLHRLSMRFDVGPTAASQRIRGQASAVRGRLRARGSPKQPCSRVAPWFHRPAFGVILLDACGSLGPMAAWPQRVES